MINFSVTSYRKIFYWLVGLYGALLLHPYSRGLPLWLPASILLPQLLTICEQTCLLWHIEFLRILFPFVLAMISINTKTPLLYCNSILGCCYLISLLPTNKYNRDLLFDILQYFLVVLLIVTLLGYDNIV